MSKTLKILSRPKGGAGEYAGWSVNPYMGCSHGCAYCYLKKGPWQAMAGTGRPALKKDVLSEEHAYHLAMAEIIANREQIRRDGGLFMTFTSDPCATATRRLFFRIAAECVGDATTPESVVVPVMLLTKDATFCPYDIETADTKDKAMRVLDWSGGMGLIDPAILHGRLAFGFTLTGHDELEPGASPNADRIKAMSWLYKRGYRTWASIEPVIDFDSAFWMVKNALTAGCEHFKIGLYTERNRLVRRGFCLDDGHAFGAYDRGKAMWFAESVMAMTEGLATVYWKRSFCDLLEGPDRKNPLPCHGMTAREFLSQWTHSVGRDWRMFDRR